MRKIMYKNIVNLTSLTIAFSALTACSALDMDYKLAELNQEKGVITISGKMPKGFKNVTIRNSFSTKSSRCLQRKSWPQDSSKFNHVEKYTFRRTVQIDKNGNYSIKLPTILEGQYCDWYHSYIEMEAEHDYGSDIALDGSLSPSLFKVLIINTVGDNAPPKYYHKLKLDHTINCKKLFRNINMKGVANIEKAKCPYMYPEMDIKDGPYWLWIQDKDIKPNIHLKIDINLPDKIYEYNCIDEPSGYTYCKTTDGEILWEQ
ncbi:hypothetical protein [Zooshikella harenae]|uniref:Lipoprotein n=1 Tax=Zooshikella harenae TaxID=2827238 RepID=A0ABS5ZKI4_9GAMM|nr:hypothetical protein [Zooshikella harenae]MBU2713791.1 hypothetical protein [Zooshikella harenae]